MELFLLIAILTLLFIIGFLTDVYEKRLRELITDRTDRILSRVERLEQKLNSDQWSVHRKLAELKEEFYCEKTVHPIHVDRQLGNAGDGPRYPDG